MIGFDEILEAPATARYHREALELIAQSVEERVYCALLGPRLSGKTLLLRFVEQHFSRLLGWTCVYIDLLELHASTQQAFFADLIAITARQVSARIGQAIPGPEEQQASSAGFRAFLAECLEIIGKDLVLIIDPLEALPTDLVQALLTSLRAAYMDQQGRDVQVTVVVSGALSLATLTVGESSPFRGIARRVFIGDLPEADSQSLILEYLAEGGVIATGMATHQLLQATSGDIYLIRTISQSCADLVNARPNRLVRTRDVQLVTRRFLQQEVFQYAPLVEAIRLIEDDPDLLECILRLLQHGSVRRSELPLPLSPDLDPLYLTGVVELAGGEHYRLQNLIYHRFLTQYFTPGRVGHVLAMTGRWDAAIDYLEASILQGNRQSRNDLLPAVINSIYASQDLAQAVHFLRRGLAAGFGVREAQVWHSPAQENYLRLVGSSERNQEISRAIPLTADRLEARAYRQQVTLRGQEAGHQVTRAIPLLIAGQKPIGVVTILDDLPAGELVDQRERDQQLVGFLSQAARALQTVNIRRQELALAGRMQASLLPMAVPDFPGWQFAAAWRPARETSGDFYDFITLPNGKLGLVIADVVDKGMGAALLMALTRTLIRTYAAAHTNRPAQLLAAANQRIIADSDSGMFVTLFYGVLDPSTGALRYANAGHPPPYLLIEDELEAAEALPFTGMPLGISEDSTWEQAETWIKPGSLLLLYTDGILDAQNSQGERYGEARMLRLAAARQGRSVQRIQEALLAEVYAFAGNEPQVDDITLVALAREKEIPGAPAELWE
jgi:serine phosphatase RsbU (regulator of sigma subunit)